MHIQDTSTRTTSTSTSSVVGYVVQYSTYVVSVSGSGSILKTHQSPVQSLKVFVPNQFKSLETIISQKIICLQSNHKTGELVENSSVAGVGSTFFVPVVPVVVTSGLIVVSVTTRLAEIVRLAATFYF